MCSEYIIFTKDSDINRALQGIAINRTDAKSWELRVKLSTKAPIITKAADGHLEIQSYTFPVQPFPNSRLSGLDSKTLNETHPGLNRIYDLPTWKTAFEKHPCLVPMTAFTEPVYWGEDAGTVQTFTPEDTSLFFVPGITLKARVPKTDHAFSLLTHTANAQMLKYHHRLLVMLKPQDALAYLDFTNAQDRLDFLNEKRWLPRLKVQKDRHMAKGWEKKVNSHLEKLEDEKKYQSALKRENLEV